MSPMKNDVFSSNNEPILCNSDLSMVCWDEELDGGFGAHPQDELVGLWVDDLL